MKGKPRCPAVSIMQDVQCMLWKGHRGDHVSGPHVPKKEVYRWQSADKGSKPRVSR